MSLTPRIDNLEQNFIINGGMDFWQRVVGNTTTVNTATAGGSYTADRFLFYSSGTTVKNFSVSRSTDVPTLTEAGSQLSFSYNFVMNTGIPSFAATDSIEPIIQRIEGSQYQFLAGKPVILSFWFKAAVSGTYGVYFKNPSAVRSYLTSFSYTSANQWQNIQVSLTLDEQISGYNFSTGLGVQICIGAVGGSNSYSNTPNTWLNTNASGIAGLTNWCSSASNYVRFTGISLTIGNQAGIARFSRAGRDIAGELMLCQRYYETISNGGPEIQHIFGVRGVTSYEFLWRFKTSKRASPTLVRSGGSLTGLTFGYSAGQIAIYNYSLTNAATATAGTVTLGVTGLNNDKLTISVGGTSLSGSAGNPAVLDSLNGVILGADAEF